MINDNRATGQTCIRHGRIGALLFAFMVLMAGASGCGPFARGTDASTEGVELFRTPHPTFTPTASAGSAELATAPLDTRPPESMQNGEQISSPQVPGPAISDPPRAVVNAPLVNLRSEPQIDSEIVATAERGAEFEIVARSEDTNWWLICCRAERTVWIASELVDTDGMVDSVPVTDSAGAVSAPTAAAAQPVPAPPGLGGGSTDSVQFRLVAEEQFPESGMVRVYLFVYDGTSALSGYRVRVQKDGQEIPVTALSFGGQPAFTWPFQDARQRFQNLKVEFPDESAAGLWTVQLIDSQGTPVGPPAEFSLGDNDPNQELYVRYERN